MTTSPSDEKECQETRDVLKDAVRLASYFEIERGMTDPIDTYPIVACYLAMLFKQCPRDCHCMRTFLDSIPDLVEAMRSCDDN